MNLFAAITMALLHRERTGEGSEVSSSLHAGGLWSNAMLAQGALLGAYVAPRPPRTTAAQRARQPVQDLRRPLDPAHHRARGQVVAASSAGRSSAPTCSPTRASRPPTSGAPTRTELAAILDPIFAAHPWPEWRKRLRHHEITFGLLGVLRDVPDDEQAVANGAVVPTNVRRDAAHAIARRSASPSRRTPADARPRARRTASIPTRCWASWATARPRSHSCGRPARWADLVAGSVLPVPVTSVPLERGNRIAGDASSFPEFPSRREATDVDGTRGLDVFPTFPATSRGKHSKISAEEFTKAPRLLPPRRIPRERSEYSRIARTRTDGTGRQKETADADCTGTRAQPSTPPGSTAGRRQAEAPGKRMIRRAGFRWEWEWEIRMSGLFTPHYPDRRAVFLFRSLLAPKGMALPRSRIGEDEEVMAGTRVTKLLPSRCCGIWHAAWRALRE